MGLTVHGPFVSLHAKDVVHLSEEQINWLFAAGSLGATLFSLAGGRLVDRFGGRLVLAASSAGHFATLVLWASAPILLAGLPVFVLSWVLMQISFIAYTTTLAQSASAETRARIVGLFGTVTGLISTAAPSIGVLLRQEWGSVAPFGAALGVGLLMVLVLVRASPRPEPVRENP
jgi:MFS family permease